MVPRGNFDLHVDAQGKSWIWCDETESNLAIRAVNELEAYKAALEQAIFIISLHKEARIKQGKDLSELRTVFEKVFMI